MGTNEKQLNAEKELVKLEKKIITLMSSETVDELRSLNIEQLDKKLLDLAKKKQEIITAQQEDVQLNDTKELVKELSAPYKDAIKLNDLLQRFVSLLNEK